MNFSGIITAILAALCMGTMGVFSRKTGLQAEVITFFRLILGALFMVILLCCTRQVQLIKKWPTWPVLIGGFTLAGFIIFYVQAMNLTTMAIAIMILYLAPLLASIFAHFFLKEKLNLASITLIATALLGFTMMMEFKIDFESGSNHMLGIIFAGLGLFCYTGYILINRTIRSDIHVYTRTFYQLLVGASCTIPFFITDFPVITGGQWPWIIGVGIIPGFLGTLFAVIALDKLPAATFGTLAYFEPIFVCLLGWSIFGETLNTMQMSGIFLIIASGTIKGYLAVQEEE